MGWGGGLLMMAWLLVLNTVMKEASVTEGHEITYLVDQKHAHRRRRRQQQQQQQQGTGKTKAKREGGVNINTAPTGKLSTCDSGSPGASYATDSDPGSPYGTGRMAAPLSRASRWPVHVSSKIRCG
ncbi:hypothetical protein F2P81_019398 [Scophthalmus maximus]|uniref:Uncharacterized protein n=1 Tax=Scophthalmus maximus TaxID=52904 RepID=A0A6A4SB45_SCOMX|nr:hypothetical protein F2P81_019398 [Scophthalmus maximus]